MKQMLGLCPAPHQRLRLWTSKGGVLEPVLKVKDPKGYAFVGVRVMHGRV